MFMLLLSQMFRGLSTIKTTFFNLFSLFCVNPTLGPCTKYQDQPYKGSPQCKHSQRLSLVQVLFGIVLVCSISSYSCSYNILIFALCQQKKQSFFWPNVAFLCIPYKRDSEEQVRFGWCSLSHCPAYRGYSPYWYDYCLPSRNKHKGIPWTIHVLIFFNQSHCVI